MDKYKSHGYANRNEYLNELSELYSEDAVYAISDVLGEEEDFDGLISMLEDFDFAGMI